MAWAAQKFRTDGDVIAPENFALRVAAAPFCASGSVEGPFIDVGDGTKETMVKLNVPLRGARRTAASASGSRPQTM